MLEAGGNRWCCSWVLVEKIGDTWIHKDTVALSTWMHAERVIENDYLTLKQKQKNVAATPQNLFCLQSCDFLKTFFLT